jgi:hypothetical protein
VAEHPEEVVGVFGLCGEPIPVPPLEAGERRPSTDVRTSAPPRGIPRGRRQNTLTTSA